ncbi:hypothetical protein DFR74_111255 [Nocardia puris]|uniref:Uncharacterized protein n=1 Tax=Nocardia puris TaxID=208602 RepID=A0A366DE65_9NOCA|nr:hypothetical protein DFR74_111255 [Nocardia puris]
MISLRARRRAFDAADGWIPFLAELIGPTILMLVMFAFAVGWVR